MDLTVPSEANMAYMLEEITKKLKMAAVSAIKPGHFDMKQYEDIYEIYDVVMGKSAFSISEVEALVTELGRLRRN